MPDIQMTPGGKNPARYRKTILSVAVLALIAAGKPAIDILDQVSYEKEGSRLEAYQDGEHIWTICKGLTRYNGKPVTQGMKLTPNECRVADRAALQEDLDAVRRMIHPAVYATMSEASKAGLADMVHNLGEQRVRDSSAVRLLNEGKRNEGCAAITLWIKDHGRDCRKAGSNCQGQPIRRMQEDELCLVGAR